MTRVLGLDPTDADSLSSAYTRVYQQIPPLVKFFQKYVPGFESAYLQEIAPMLGVRESRRIVGRYMLTADDLVVTRRGCRFRGRLIPCAIGRGGIRPDKREGDGASPAGAFDIATLHYRPDRVAGRALGFVEADRGGQPGRDEQGWVVKSEDAGGDGAGEEAAGAVAGAELSARAFEYLTAVSLRIDSLEMAVRYAGMNSLGQQLLMGDQREESWNILLPQVMDIVMVRFFFVKCCDFSSVNFHFIVP
jgi:hypothetical protein